MPLLSHGDQVLTIAPLLRGQRNAAVRGLPVQFNRRAWVKGRVQGIMVMRIIVHEVNGSEFCWMAEQSAALGIWSAYLAHIALSQVVSETRK
jgi:hypothetical protein